MAWFCGWSANNGPLFGGSHSLQVRPAESSCTLALVSSRIVVPLRPSLASYHHSFFKLFPERHNVSGRRRPFPSQSHHVLSCELSRSCAGRYTPPGGETRPQSSARRSGCGTALSFSTLPWQKWLPATADNYPAMTEGSLGSQGEVTHCYARADRKGLLLFQYFTPAQDRRHRGTGGTGDGAREGERAREDG